LAAYLIATATFREQIRILIAGGALPAELAANLVQHDVVAERFADSAVAANLPQHTLPCVSPACAALPGEACGEFSTIGPPTWGSR
jgi:hypothetical protein